MNAPDKIFTPSKLNERAMLIKLTIRKANLTQRDSEAESIIQQQMNDGALMVNRKLFRDPSNPINQIVSAMGQVYSFHKSHTFPYIDKGPRLIKNTLFMEYREVMTERIRHVEAMLSRAIPNYDSYVQQDIAYRSQGVAPRASVSDYPTASDFNAATQITLLPMPLPDGTHFMFDLPAEELDEFAAMQARVEQVVRADTVKRMLDPVKHLAEKLAVPIGEKGSVFRDSAVENVVEAVDLVRKIGVVDDPEVNTIIKELTQTVATYAENMEWLRESPIVRAEAQTKLDDIARKMAAFMGA
jgi:hypothetical protein